MDIVEIVPSEGKLIRLRDGTILPKEGREVMKDTFINRKLKSGDILIKNYNMNISDLDEDAEDEDKSFVPKKPKKK